MKYIESAPHSRSKVKWSALCQFVLYFQKYDFYGKQCGANLHIICYSITDSIIGACSYTVKLLLFMSYCGSLYTSSIWCKYTKKQYYQMEVVYNNVFRRFFGYDRFCSASQMFVENRAENFETRMRRLIYGFREGLNASRNSLVICWMNSAAWSSSGLRQKWEKCLYMQSWINT